MEDKSVNRKEFFIEGFAALLKPIARILDEKVETRVSRNFLRPPGAIDEISFLTTCTRCPHCAQACPSNAIVMAKATDGIAAGTPYIDPYNSPCTLCEGLDCIAACPTEALTKGIQRADVRMGTAFIDDSLCVARQGMMCEACFKSCPLKGGAIIMDGLSGPVIREELCTGCGVCAHSCVSRPNSIKIIPAKR